ncbi:MAG: PQQ-dependent sugar dehydrogenase [Verrucomicrobia bacterium]|nr:PQQ-dependent sugar dehydrogenase [Verrucomicrobiota bacterium]
MSIVDRILRVLLPSAMAWSLSLISGAAAALHKTVLVTDCENPMQMEVLADGRILYVERAGRVKLWSPETRTSALIASRDVESRANSSTPATGGAWEAGLLAVAVDPGFARNHWVYLYYSPKGGREFLISRLTLDGTPPALTGEKVLLRVPVDLEVCCHYGAGLGFDAGGNLYISTGDNTVGFECDAFAPTDYREGRKFFDAARSAGNANDLRGKILRIHPEPDGSVTIPAGNLFPPGTPNTRPEIYVMGCRNPFRFSLDARSGTLYFADVGPDAPAAVAERGPAGFDEFNRTKTAGNFGWPFLLADNRPYRQYDFATRQSGPAQDPAKPLNLSPLNTGPRELPPAQPSWMHYPIGPSARYPIFGSGGRSGCAGPVYHFDAALGSPRKLPAEHDNCLFLYEWMRNWIIVVKLDEHGERVEMKRFAPEMTFPRPTDLEIGPDGALYVIEFGTGWENNADARIVRIGAAP